MNIYGGVGGAKKRTAIMSLIRSQVQNKLHLRSSRHPMKKLDVCNYPKNSLSLHPPYYSAF